MLCDFWLLLDLNISLFCFLSIEKESAFFALMKQPEGGGGLVNWTPTSQEVSQTEQEESKTTSRSLSRVTQWIGH